MNGKIVSEKIDRKQELAAYEKYYAALVAVARQVVSEFPEVGTVNRAIDRDLGDVIKQVQNLRVIVARGEK